MSGEDYEDADETSDDLQSEEMGSVGLSDRVPSEISPTSRARPAGGEGRKLGRPTNLTPEIQQTIFDHITRGLPMRTAALVAGVSVRSINDWRTRGKSGEEPYASFYEAVELAKAQFAAVHAGVINEAGRLGDWKASAWLLERRTSAFVKREKVEAEAKVEHSGGVKVELYIPDNGRGGRQ